jgi:hypothetical protein
VVVKSLLRVSQPGTGICCASPTRASRGEWILLDAETWAGPDSLGPATARLADTTGYFGRAVPSLLFERR